MDMKYECEPAEPAFEAFLSGWDKVIATWLHHEK